jgi:hypothetical protein
VKPKFGMSGAIHPFHQVPSADRQTDSFIFLLVFSQTELLSTFTKKTELWFASPCNKCISQYCMFRLFFDVLRQTTDLRRQFKYNPLKFRKNLVQNVKILTTPFLRIGDSKLLIQLMNLVNKHGTLFRGNNANLKLKIREVLRNVFLIRMEKLISSRHHATRNFVICAHQLLSVKYGIQQWVGL